MKQNNFLVDAMMADDKAPSVLVKPVWHLFVDGAARNNPGAAGIGVHLLHGDSSVIKTGFFVGQATNNQAEYLALLVGLILLQEKRKPSETLLISSDSELIVKQIKGLYRVKQVELQKLYDQVIALLSVIPYTIEHIPRSKNAVADACANMGIDKKIPLPDHIMRNVRL